jgi:hypothetical protein
VSGDCTMVKRISCGGGHLSVRGYFAAGDGEDSLPKGRIPKLVRANSGFYDAANQLS